jgi:photosystem II PsbJ protein
LGFIINFCFSCAFLKLLLQLKILIKRFYTGDNIYMAGTGRIPLWLVALVGGLGVIVVVGSFIFGAYSGLGSSL